MKIEFIIPTYNRPHHLMSTINSIFAQRSDRWSIHVVADCPPEGSLDKIVNFFKDDERIRFSFLPTRYNDYGHTPRNYGLENAKEDWVIMTGEDNYYTPVFVDHFLGHLTPNTNFVFCDMVHNWLNYDYGYIKCEPRWGRVDMGNFMTKREYSSQMRLNVNNIQADGEFVDEYIRRFPGDIIHIAKALYVHN